MAASTVAGDRLLGGLDTVLLSSLNGGSGVDLSGAITFQARDGSSGVIDLSLFGSSSSKTVGDLISFVNDEITAITGDSSSRLSLNGVGNGFEFNDGTGGSGTLIFTGAGATALGIDTGAGGVTASRAGGTNMQTRYVSEGTLLETLNAGQGVRTGSFTIVDGLGQEARVTIGGDEKTVYDVISEINSRGLAVTARVNDNGDGIIIEEDAAALGGATAFQAIRITDNGGTTAKDLGIAGTAEEIGGSIDGSYERVVDLDIGDTLNEVVTKINASGIPVSATVVNTGAGSTPFRMNLSSDISGSGGELVVDTGGVDIGLQATSRGQDAKVFFGGDTPEESLLITSRTNTLSSVIDGVDIDLLKAGDEVVEVTVRRDTSGIEDAVANFVTTFNDSIERINDYDFYDTDTEQRGILLGDPTLARVRNSLYRVVNQRAVNLDGSFQFLTQVGIRVGTGGTLTFDRAKFQSAYESDPQGVADLFAAYDARENEAEEIAEGVTIEGSGLTFSSLGFGPIFDNLLDELTNSVDGVTKRAQDGFDRQIELLETRVGDLDARIETRRETLQRQFAAMELALSDLQNQSSALGGLGRGLPGL